MPLHLDPKSRPGPLATDWQRVALGYEARIAELEAALRNARAQLVTLGGEALHVHGDRIQRATLAQIDAALGNHSS